MCEYKRPSLVYEKEDLLISGQGKYHGYNYYQVASIVVGGRDKGEGIEDRPPVDVKSLLP